MRANSYSVYIPAVDVFGVLSLYMAMARYTILFPVQQMPWHTAKTVASRASQPPSYSPLLIVLSLMFPHSELLGDTLLGDQQRHYKPGECVCIRLSNKFYDARTLSTDHR